MASLSLSDTWLYIICTTHQHSHRFVILSHAEYALSSSLRVCSGEGYQDDHVTTRIPWGSGKNTS